ncbi:CLUMA_CG013262, isoform A [Clunio marinus]|uniref:CLUMA_CG013262, isoform A n=1 Tax=Clunio marinus TaxID=568069 RepID=A0A1J1II76_9DIPT|nr:CLUMA_CG013262, isoform A [Clunio marinus]
MNNATGSSKNIEAPENSTANEIPNGTGPKMTLQLVLPNSSEDPYGLENGVHRRSRPVSRTGSVLESKSPGFINTRLVNYNRGVSYQPSVATSKFQSEPENIPPPSSQEEKSKMTKRYFATITAVSYAIFLVIFGTIVFVGNAVAESTLNFSVPIPEIFSIFMLTVGFCYFIFLYIDIRLHIKKAKHALKVKENRIKMFEEQLARTEAHLQNSLEFSQTNINNNNNNIHLQIPLPDLSASNIQPISHRYCFVTGRHGEVLYLKMGAAWFCFGLLIHSALTLSYQIIYFTQDDACRNIPQLIVEIMFPLYSLFILFFIFKYCNIIINSYRGLARIMFMHAIGTSLAFWMFTIVRETQDAINLKRIADAESKEIIFQHNFNKMYLNSSNYEIEATMGFDPMTSERITKITNMNAVECPGPEDLNTIYRNFAPYLYPFIIEFCILIVGIFYMIWANINHCPKKLSASGHDHGGHGSDSHNHNNAADSNQFTSLGSIPEEGDGTANGGVIHRPPPSETSDHCRNLMEHDNQYKTNVVVYADCHAASRGLFGGMILMIMTIVFIILLHIAANEPDYIETGVIVDRVFELTVLLILIVAVIVAYFQTSKLDINLHPISKLDDVLLFIAIPAFFSETIFSLVAAINFGRILNISIIIAQIVQVLIQTPWIIDALRRCSNTIELRKKKPGRELVTFMTIANVSLWIYYTFSVRNTDIDDERYEFFGYVLWSILNHVSLPLIMFYRFHASVCLVDIWKHSYEPGEFAH